MRYFDSRRLQWFVRPAHATEVTVKLSFVDVVIIEPTQWTEIAAKLYCAAHAFIAYLHYMQYTQFTRKHAHNILL